MLGPLKGGSPLDTVLRETGSVGDGAKREGVLGRKELQGALEAGGELGEDDTGLSLEALGSSVNDRNHS